MELRPEDIQEIVRIFADSQMEELRVELGHTRVHLSKSGGNHHTELGSAAVSNTVEAPHVAHEPGPAEASAATAVPVSSPPPRSAAPGPPSELAASSAPALAAADSGLYELRSPLLGVFYRRPSPEESPFVDVGDEVSADDPVCVIEVMKMYTRVPATTAGRIAEICVEDGQLVEAGQVLARIEPQ